MALRFALALVLLCLAPLTAGAQTQAAPPLALFADEIRYEAETETLVATGNVQVFYQDYVLSAGSIRYGGTPPVIQASGPIRLESPDGAILLASLAELSPDFQSGLIQGARLILNEQFQIAAVEGRRTKGRFNSLYRTVATSCTVCGRDSPPIWRVRAKRVTQDEQAERLYFEDAVFDVFGVPLLFSPRLSVPAPGVERATGILVPSATASNISGIGAKFPYFFAIGDHADLTVTPFLTTSGTAILEGEYRQRFANGGFNIDGALALDDGLGGGAGRGYVRAEGDFALPRGYDFAFSIKQATDRSFLGQFGYSEADRLESFVSISRTGTSSFFDARAEGYQTLREDEDQRSLPYILPQVTYRKLWSGGYGTLGVEAGALTLLREDGRDVIRGNAGIDWRGDMTLSNGVLLAGIADVDVDLYASRDDPNFKEGLLLRATPTVGAEVRWPLVRRTATATHVIEPVAQILYSENLGEAVVPNEDSLLPELDENNLFALNRFPGRDARETGFRLNAGISYARLSESGLSFDATLGRIFKLEDDEAFYDGSGLRQASSDYVTAASLRWPGGVALRGRGLFDDGLDFKRLDVELDYASELFDGSVSYIFLAEDNTDPDLGFLEERQELAFSTRYRFKPNWELNAEWRYDLAADNSISAGGSLTYGNECVVATLGLERRFTSSNNVPTDTRLTFEVSLAGFGAPSSQGWPRRQCDGI